MRARWKLTTGRWLLVLAVLSGTSSLFAQRDEERREDQPPRFRESVAFDTDSTVVKRLADVQDYVAAKKWQQAIDIIEQTAAEHGETLVAVEPGHYVNAGTYCHLLLAAFPEEGRAAYRARVDPQARGWFETGRTSRDEALLGKVLRQAFVSSYGDDALLLLGQWAWERGETATARAYWTRMLPLHEEVEPGKLPPVLRYPDTDHDRAGILARLVLCSLVERDFDRAGRERQAFATMHPEARGKLAGREGKLAEILAAVAREARGWERPCDDESAGTFALNAERNKTLPRAIDVETILWSAPLPPNRLELPTSRPALADRGPLSYFPVVSDGIVFVNDADRVFAYDLRTGRPAWSGEDEPAAKALGGVPESPASEGTVGNALSGVRHPQAGGGTPQRAFPTGGLTLQHAESALNRSADRATIYSAGVDRQAPLPIRPVIGVPWYTMTAHEGKLYARMGWPVAARAEDELRVRPGRLVCLDIGRQQGKVLWSIQADEVEAGWEFEGSPLLADDRLYIALRRNRPETQTNVACFDARTGRLVWNRKVCAAVSTVAEGFNVLSHNLLTLAGETLFYSTNVGAIAAIDRRDGRLRWFVTYESRRPDDAAELSDPRKQGLTPCLYHRGTLVAAPADSDRIMAVDASTGVMKWQRSLIGGVRHLLGVGEGRLIVGGDHLWGLDLHTGRIVWRSPLTDDPAEFGYGRGILAGEVVYWPKRDEIIVFDQQTGRMRRRIHLRALHGTGGGNLLIAGGTLLIAEPDRLVAYGQSAGKPGG